MLIAAASFVGILGLFWGIYWLFILRPEGQAERVLERRLNPNRTTRAKRLSLLKSVAPLSSVPVLQKALTRSNALVRPLERLVEQSGLPITVGKLVLASVFAGLTAYVVALQLLSHWWMALVPAALAAYAPYLGVRFAMHRRIMKFEDQFPEAIDLIARALRAGHALTTGLGMVVDELPDPVRTEFRLLHDRQNFGMPLGDALRSFADRVPLLDARFFVTAVLTQREAGGNLAEVLDSLAALIRERFRIKRQVRVLSAHGRITGWVLASLPPAVAAMMFIVAPDFIIKLFTDPLGIQMVTVALVLQVIGVLVIRRIVNIEI